MQSLRCRLAAFAPLWKTRFTADRTGTVAGEVDALEHKHDAGSVFARVRIPLLFVLFAALLASRRGAQLLSPQVWCEEGYLVRDFVDHGWSAFLQTQGGYLVLVPKTLSRIAMAISLYHYPIVSAVLAWTFTGLVGLTIALAPTHLRGKALCALAVFLVPTDPEVFGITIYTFWWSSLCLFLLAVWDESRPSPLFRLVLLVSGGLSSPIVFVMLPVLVFRAIWYRTFVWERILAAVAASLALTQWIVFDPGPTAAPPPLASIRDHTIPKYCGFFLWGNFNEEPVLLWIAGSLIVLLIGAYLFLERRNPTTWILAISMAAAIAASVARVDPEIVHPHFGGPRYFFFPYVLMSWMLVQMVWDPRFRWLRGVAGAVLVCAWTNALPVWSRTQEDLCWSAHVRSSRCFARYDLPVEYDGVAAHAWPISPQVPRWESALRTEWLCSCARSEELLTFPYRWDPDNGENVDPRPIPSASDATAANGERHEPTMSERTSPSGKRELVLKMRKGDRVRFRSITCSVVPSVHVESFERDFLTQLPASELWRTLEFSNVRLPETFALVVSDDGGGTGEWGM